MVSSLLPSSRSFRFSIPLYTHIHILGTLTGAALAHYYYVNSSKEGDRKRRGIGGGGGANIRSAPPLTTSGSALIALTATTTKPKAEDQYPYSAQEALLLLPQHVGPLAV